VDLSEVGGQNVDHVDLVGDELLRCCAGAATVVSSHHGTHHHAEHVDLRIFQRISINQFSGIIARFLIPAAQLVVTHIAWPATRPAPHL
jgi:hypothetical protein